MDLETPKQMKLLILLFYLALTHGTNDGMISDIPKTHPLSNIPEVRIQQLTSDVLKTKDSLRNIGMKAH